MRPRTILIALAVLFGIPLAAFVYISATGGKVVFVHNATGGDIQVSAVATDGRYVEREEPKPLEAKGFTWIIFFPRVKGGLNLSCTGDKGMAVTVLGTPEAPAPMFSNVTLTSCAYDTHAPIAPPQPG
jgi:hypothetical protein